MHMSFRPDSPLNRLVLLWPGVPIAGCALGFSLALYQVAQTRSGSFAALAIAMGLGLVLSLGLLFHCFFIAWPRPPDRDSRSGLTVPPDHMVHTAPAAWCDRRTKGR